MSVVTVRFLRLLSANLTLVAVVLLAAYEASAIVLLDTDFTADEGYSDGSIVFQQPNGAGNGIWFGQDPSSNGVPAVDSTAGVVTTVGGPGAEGGGNFRRNAWSLGAAGGALGAGGVNEQNQAGFTLGDRIIVEIDYQFTLDPAAANNTFFNVGVKDCFNTCGFEAAPFAGMELGYSGFEDGLLRVFTNLGRVVSTPPDAAFALQINTASVGIDNGFSGEEPIDLVSDDLRFTYEAELVDDSMDVWQATELTVTNLTQGGVIAQASIDNPDALESFVWNTTGIDNPFTDANEAGVARGDGSDMFLGVQWLHAALPGDEAVTDRLRFEYLPNLPPVAGDYSGNGVVDAADYTIWRDSEGSTGAGLPADGTGDDLAGVPDGDVDQFDYDFWAANFGASATATSAALPEPSAAVIAILGMVSGIRSRR